LTYQDAVEDYQPKEKMFAVMSINEISLNGSEQSMEWENFKRSSTVTSLRDFVAPDDDASKGD